MAMLIGAGRVLAKLRHALAVPVKFIFQPAEEFGAGADAMIKAGALGAQTGGVEATSMFGMHCWPDLPVGHATTRAGPLFAARDHLRIRITGPGGHAAMPHQTRDPILAASAIVSALQSIVSRNLPPGEPAVVSVCSINSGVPNFNIIPTTVQLQGTIRAHTQAARDIIRRRVHSLACDTARAFECHADVDVEPDYPVQVNDPDLTARLREVAGPLLRGGAVEPLTQHVMGSEDFAFYSHVIPASFLLLGTRKSSDAPHVPVHCPEFDFNDDALALGVRIWCHLALAQRAGSSK
jgi:amidohydrolase